MNVSGFQPHLPISNRGPLPQQGPSASPEVKMALKALGMEDGILSKDTSATSPLKQMGETLQSLRVMTPKPDQAQVLSLLGISDAVLVMALQAQAVDYLKKMKLKMSTRGIDDESLTGVFGLSEEEMMMVSDASGGIHLIRRSMKQLEEELA